MHKTEKSFSTRKLLFDEHLQDVESFSRTAKGLDRFYGALKGINHNPNRIAELDLQNLRVHRKQVWGSMRKNDIRTLRKRIP